jgi:hypothetical protein
VGPVAADLAVFCLGVGGISAVHEDRRGRRLCTFTPS